jgi:hypothetical protein
MGLTLIFIIIFDVLLNDESPFCILPQDFKEFYDNIDADVSLEEYVKAQTTVDKYIEQKEAEPKPKDSKPNPKDTKPNPKDPNLNKAADVSAKPFYAK